MAFYEQLLNLFHDPAGVVVYHSVLSTAIAGALISAVAIWRQRKFPQGYRMLIGLSFMLGIRIILLVGSIFGGSATSAVRPILAVLDQASYILGIIFILWLWGYPEPHRAADTSVTLLSLATLFLTLYHVFTPAGQFPSPLAGFTWIELIWFVMGWGLLLFGSGLLLKRQPNGWQYGLTISLILLAGYGAAVFFSPSQTQRAATIRLAHMIGYPLIIALPFRFAITKSPQAASGQNSPVSTGRRRVGIHLPVLKATLDFSPDLSSQNLYRRIVKLTSHAIVADICLLIETPEPQGDVEILSGFDLIRQDYISSLTVESKKVPLLSTFIRREQTLHLPASSTSRDLINLSYILQLRQSGHLLATPIRIPHSDSPKGLVLLSPFSERQWVKDDQDYLSKLVELINQALSSKPPSSKKSSSQLADALEEVKAKYQKQQEENQQLREKLKRLQALFKKQQSEMQLEDSPSTVEQLRRENKSLKDRADRLSAMILSEDDEQLRGHLKLALEEIAALKEDLAQAEERVHALQQSTSDDLALAVSQQQAMTAFAKEVKEPLEALVHYSDLLFDQSINVLSSMQRKMLQRMKNYQEKIDYLVNDITEERVLRDGQAQTALTYQAEFRKSLHHALNANREQIQGSQLSLQVDLPQTLLPLDLPQDVLDDILIILLSNAAHQTPHGGEIALKLQTFKENSEQSFAHIQIKDQGEGFSSTELPYVIDHSEFDKDADLDKPQEIKLNLSSVKDMVEDYEGRIWVDNHPDRGSIISLLLPFVPQKRIGSSIS